MGRRVIKASEISTLPSSTNSTKRDIDGVSSRGIVNLEINPDAEQQIPDGYLDRLIKYIPAEIVAAYLTMQNIVATMAESIRPFWIEWAVFGALLLLTPLYIWRVTRAPGLPPAWLQIGISTLSFAIWVFALGGPFDELPWYQAAYGALILPIYTLALPIIDGD